MMNGTMELRRLAAGFGVLALTAAAGAAAAQQTAVDPRWQPWVGCWQPADAGAAQGTAPVVCVVPTGSAGAVEVLTVVDGRVAERDRLSEGERVPSTRDECSGWESVSADGRRVYRRAEHNCAGGLQRRASGLMAISPAGEWLDIHGVSAGGNTGIRVVRYRDVGLPDNLPAEVLSALRGRTLSVSAARTAAAARVSPQEVVAATRQVDSEVVEAWLVERRQGFVLDARQLVQLADAGVSPRVIDLMVALSYPDVFALDLDAREGEFREDDSSTPDRWRQPRPVYPTWGYPGYGWGYYPGYGYGYGRYGRYGNYPVVIVRRNPSDDDDSGSARPRAVNGRGYTQGGRSGGTESVSRPSSGPSGSSSGSSGGSSSGGSGSSGGGSGRTAKPRS